MFLESRLIQVDGLSAREAWSAYVLKACLNLVYRNSTQKVKYRRSSKLKINEVLCALGKGENPWYAQVSMVTRVTVPG